MPRLDGLDLLETIRDQSMDASVLILSGEASIPKVVAAMKLGAVSYLEKPFSMDALKREVRSAIRERRERSQAGGPRSQPQTILIRPGAPDGGFIGRYRVESILGTGGMGTVYRCFDPTLERPVAVKVLGVNELDPGKRREMLDRFALEARAAGRLRHPRIVTVHDFGQDDQRGLTFLAMELVEGQSLFELQKGAGKLSWQFLVAIAHQIADALEYAHDEGVIHRDIKPANIIVGREDEVKLVDFGIAKLQASSLTQTGMILGTPSYLSPEMIQGVKIDRRSDQFSLGTVLLEALSGRKLFAAESFEALAGQILNAVTPTFAELGVDAPPALEAIVRKLHHKEPGARYQDETKLIDDLARVGREAGIELRRATAPFSRSAVAPE